LIAFKTYQTSLTKVESLKEFLNNPEALVAVGETGKHLLEKLEESRKA
jgi:hypothetical protein